MGGHLTHGSPVNFSGKWFDIVPYGLDPETETIDYDEVARLARRAQAQDDHRRRERVPAHHRLRALRRDRPRGGRVPDGGHGPHRRPRGHGRAPEPGAARRLRDLDLAQDAARPALRLHPVQGGARQDARQGRVPGHPGRAARARHRRPRPSRSARRCSPSSRPTSTRSSSTPASWARRWSSAACASSRAARTTTCMLVDLTPAGVTGKDAEKLARGRRASPSTRTRSPTTRRARSSRAASASAARP